ncbi:uncharacterized protein LOC104445725 [Eucalyptus grandis]|uniref:uncharacterized protein LOC104445725 n=1 Tax=Eucalyptus grandis TaxID=71139 RepID=UPI00192E76DF|nr:uncharacterized protein LOC104445725 [Eucalyptus grandis]XP_039170052.1 uncharacterized protein LOC104445725 [Eucalyptus grandis]
MEMEFERDFALGADLDISSIEAEKIRQIERMAKIEKRREERARSKAWEEESKAMLARACGQADLDIFSITMKKMPKERMAEIEKVKKRREETAREKARHEELMAMLAERCAQAEIQD